MECRKGATLVCGIATHWLERWNMIPPFSSLCFAERTVHTRWECTEVRRWSIGSCKLGFLKSRYKKFNGFEVCFYSNSFGICHVLLNGFSKRIYQFLPLNLSCSHFVRQYGIIFFVDMVIIAGKLYHKKACIPTFLGWDAGLFSGRFLQRLLHVISIAPIP